MKCLKIVKNKIVNTEEKEIIIKGASIIDPALVYYRDKHTYSKDDINQIKKLGFNTVKVVIVPSMWEKEKDYSKKYLDPIVKYCKEFGLYCWLDWHAQGNPITNETRRPDLLDNGFLRYNAKKEIAKKVLISLAKRYSKENHVILELFANPLGPSWDEWITLAQKWVDEIRKYTDTIISISGVEWMSDLNGVIENPIKSNNIIYGIAFYPGFKINEKALLRIKKKYPVIITECGFIEKSTDEGGVFEGNVKSYAIDFKKFIDTNKLSWIAWVYHPFGLTSKASVLINSWTIGDLSNWGKFVKEKML